MSNNNPTLSPHAPEEDRQDMDTELLKQEYLIVKIRNATRLPFEYWIKEYPNGRTQ